MQSHPPAETQVKAQPGRSALWFTIPAIAGILALLLLVTYKQGLLASKDKLYFNVGTAAGITKGMPVRLNGFAVGTVDNIKLLPPSSQSDQRVLVELGIYRDYMAYIPKPTKARLAQEGLIGQSMIELKPLRYDARPVANGEMLEFEVSRGIGEIAADLHQQLNPVLQNMQTLTTQLNDPNGSLQQVLKSSNEFLVSLQQTNRKIQEALEQTSSSIKTIEQQSGTAFKTANHALGEIDKSIPGMLSKIDKTTDNLQKVSEDIQHITSHSSDRVPHILDDTQSIISSGNEIVQGAQKTWPISAMTGPREARSAPMDSQQGLPVVGGK